MSKVVKKNRIEMRKDQHKTNADNQKKRIRRKKRQMSKNSIRHRSTQKHTSNEIETVSSDAK